MFALYQHDEASLRDAPLFRKWAIAILLLGTLVLIAFLEHMKDADPEGLEARLPAVTALSRIASTSATRGVQTMAWLYPGEPGCAAPSEYSDGRRIDILKPEYFRVGETGVLEFLTEESAGCNGYSPANVADLKRHSKEQYVTVASAYAGGMEPFLRRALDEGADVRRLVDFVIENDFAGVELDFEDFGGWTSERYELYKRFVTLLGDELHREGKRLMVDAPATANAEEEAWFVWRYEDFVDLPVDTIVIMAYDHQFDHGAGTPVAPLEWVGDSIAWALSKFPDKTRLSVGIPSYGYRGETGTQAIFLQNGAQMRAHGAASFGEGRDPASGELMAKDGAIVYFYQDSASMDAKLAVAAEHGISSVSVWSLGGNPWFTAR